MNLLSPTRIVTFVTLLALSPVAGAHAAEYVNGTLTESPAVNHPSKIQWLPNATVDIVGGTAHNEADPGRAKGNSYRVDINTTLNEAEFWLDFSDTQTLTYYVFESPVEFGSYSEIYRASQLVAGTGAAWYSTGPISVAMTANNHYIIAVSWDGTVLYSYDVGDSQPTSFGAETHGYAPGVNPLPNPISSDLNDLAIYYQRLTTNEPTVPVTAATWSRIKSLID